MDTAPFSKTYRETARHPANQATLDTLGAYYTERALTPSRRNPNPEERLTPKGRQLLYIGEPRRED